MTITPASRPASLAVPSPVTLVRRAGNAHLDRAVRSGGLLPLARGVYAPTSEMDALPPWDRYLARVHAVALAHPDAVFALESAAVLRGWPVIAEPREVHVLTGPSGTSRVVGRTRYHTAGSASEAHDLGGMLVTAAVDTVVAIARLRHPVVGLATAHAALRTGAVTDATDLRETNEELASSRGRRHARWALQRADPTPESTLEVVSLAAVEWLGFDPPELQHEFRSAERTDRADFWWVGAAVAGEADGDLKYDGRFGDATPALRERRARDARLMRAGARAVAHWTWSDVAHPDRLRAALVSAGLRPTRPASLPQLRSLTAALTRQQ